MATDVLGAPVKRVEDPRFITGKGRYLDDIKLPGMAHLAILRSPYAHANIRSIDTSRRQGEPGVLAVITGADIPYNPLPMAWPAGGASGLQNNVNTPAGARHRRGQVDGRGRRRGRRRDAEAQAQDALELIQVDWEPLPAVVDAEKATQPGAPQLHENAPNNVVFEWTVGDKDGTDAAFDGRRGRRQAAPRQPAADPEPDGDPRRHRLVQPGHRRVHDLDVQPDAAHPAAAARQLRDGHPGAQAPLHQPGRGRRLRLQDLLLRRHGPRPARQQGDRRPPGQVGRGPARELPEHDPRPRPHHVRRGRRHKRDGEVTGLRVKTLRQPRRPPLDHRPRHPDHALRPRPVRAATRSPTSTAR